MKPEKHKFAEEASTFTSKMSCYFKETMLKGEDLTRATARGVFSYHSVRLDFSFRGNDSSSKLILLTFYCTFSCACLKNDVLATNESPLAEVKLWK